MKIFPITFFMVLNFCGFAVAMQDLPIQEWPQKEAAEFQEKLEYIIWNAADINNEKKFPLFKAISDFQQSQLPDISNAREAWQKLKKYKDRIKVGNKKFDRQTILTAAFALCSDLPSLAYYFACCGQSHLYPHVHIWKCDGLLQAAASAEKWSHKDFTKFLKKYIERGMPITVKNPQGQLPLHIVALHRRLMDVKLLCRNSEWALEEDHSGKTAIDYAERNEFYKNQKINPIIEYLKNQLQNVSRE